MDANNGAVPRSLLDPNGRSIASGASSRWNQGQNTALLAGGGAAGRTRLSDITNTVSSARIGSAQETLKAAPCQSAKDYVGQLIKENSALLKLLGEKNKIIEVTGAELQKSRLELQKASQQNWQLARANSQMLEELNLSKDRIKKLQHELNCTLAAFKVKAKDLEDKENLNKELVEKFGYKELGNDQPEALAGVTHLTTGNKTSKPSKEDNLEEQSICSTFSTQPVKHVEKVTERRKSVRKKTSKLNFETCDSVEHLLKEVNDTTSQLEDPSLISENKTCKRARKHIPRQQSMSSNMSIQQDASAECVDGRRKSLRRKSNNSKSETHEAMVDLPMIEDNQDQVESLMSEMLHVETFVQPEDPNSNTDSKTLKSKEAVDCSTQIPIAAAEDKGNTRRKSVLKKSYNSKPELPEAEDSLKIEDDILPAYSLGCQVTLQEDVSAKCKCSSAATKRGEHDTSHFSNVGEVELQRRSSVGRPLRRAAQKVNSYVEPTLKCKMRREDYLPVL